MCSRAERRLTACAASTWRRAAICSISSPRARAICSTRWFESARSKPASASTRWSATTPAPTRRAPPTCSCITCSARSTAGAARGVTRSAAWARSRRRWRKRPSGSASRSPPARGVAQVIVDEPRRAGRAAGRRQRWWTRRCVVANVNPRLLFLELVDASALDAGFPAPHARLQVRLGDVSHERRARGAAAISPVFRRAEAHHALRASSWRPRSLTWSRPTSMRATMGCSRAPIVEMLIPSTVDASLAPQGKHVASLFCQHFALASPGRTQLGRRARGGRRPGDRYRHSARARISRRRSRRAGPVAARSRTRASGSSAATSFMAH